MILRERVFWVVNGNISTINEYLDAGWRVKSITAIPEPVSCSADRNDSAYMRGDICTYFVLYKDDDTY